VRGVTDEMAVTMGTRGRAWRARAATGACVTARTGRETGQAMHRLGETPDKMTGQGRLDFDTGRKDALYPAAESIQKENKKN
jgi:hypothetical protein